jgi:hypothetical protein
MTVVTEHRLFAVPNYVVMRQVSNPVLIGLGKQSVRATNSQNEGCTHNTISSLVQC